MTGAPIAQQKVGDLLEALAARTPAPGGGAAAALAQALAAALARMVVSYSTGGKGATPEADRVLFERAAAKLDAARAEALRLADADADAFKGLSALWKLDRDDPRRRAEWPGAVMKAIEVPRAVMGSALQTLGLLETLAGRTNPRLASDLAIAAILADAAARSAACNVQVNLPLLDEKGRGAALAAECAGRLERAADLCATVEERVARQEHA